MNFNFKKTSALDVNAECAAPAIQQEQTNERKYLKAKERFKVHCGTLHGIVGNGGKFNVGQYQVEIVIHENSPFPTIQIWEYPYGATPEKQEYIRTKKVIVQAQQKLTPKLETVKIKSQITHEDLL
jgi:hypothetical protein